VEEGVRKAKRMQKFISLNKKFVAETRESEASKNEAQLRGISGA